MKCEFVCAHNVFFKNIFSIMHSGVELCYSVHVTLGRCTSTAIRTATLCAPGSSSYPFRSHAKPPWFTRHCILPIGRTTYRSLEKRHYMNTCLRGHFFIIAVHSALCGLCLAEAIMTTSSIAKWCEHPGSGPSGLHCMDMPWLHILILLFLLLGLFPSHGVAGMALNILLPL